MKTTIPSFFFLYVGLVTAWRGIGSSFGSGKPAAFVAHISTMQAGSGVGTPCNPQLNMQQTSSQCGHPGSLARPKPTKLIKAASLTACANSCLNDPSQCVAFAFAKAASGSSSCQFYGKTLKVMGYSRAATGAKKFYNSGCFSCSTNLITNGDFADGTWDPWTAYNGAELQVEGSPGHHYGTMDLTQANSYGAAQYPFFNVTQGQEYIFSMDYMTTDASCATAFNTIYEGATNANLPIALGNNSYIAGTPTPVNIWKNYQFSFAGTFTSQQYDIFSICDDGNTGPLVYFANFSVTPASSKIYYAESKATGPNIVAQPNFDSGTFDAYNLYLQNTSNPPTIVQPGLNGATYAAQVSSTNNQDVFVITKSIAPKTAVYRMSFDYIFENPSSSDSCFLLIGSITSDFALVNATDARAYTFQSGDQGPVYPLATDQTSVFTSIQAAEKGEAFYYLIQCGSTDSSNVIFTFGNLQAVPLT